MERPQVPDISAEGCTNAAEKRAPALRNNEALCRALELSGVLLALFALRVVLGSHELEALLFEYCIDGR